MTGLRKIVWVTGASTGIGRAAALRLAQDGWMVAASARSVDRLAELVAEGGGLIKAYPGDVTDESAMKSVVNAIENDLGPIDMALLNAGNYFPDTYETFTASNFKKQYDVNVFGVMHCVEPLLEKFRARGRGHIAIVASVAGYRGLPNSLSYGSSKAALINFTEALAAECSGTGIKIQVVNPGFIKTPLTDKNDFYMPMLMDVDDAAKALVQGLYSNAFEITFPWVFAMLTRVFGMLPNRLYIRAIAMAKKRQRGMKA